MIITKEQLAKLPKEYREYFKPLKNDIATLKSVNVLRYLIRLCCPKGGTVLDPFGGSGTTAIACIIEGMDYILIEKRKRFAEVIIPKRLEFWSDPNNWTILKEHNALPSPKVLKQKKQNVGMDKWLKK